MIWSGPEHYHEAETLLVQAENARTVEDTNVLTAAALVHATLAGVALAAAERISYENSDNNEWRERAVHTPDGWEQVASTPKEQETPNA